MYKKGQTVVQDTVTLIFIVVAVIILALIAPVTTPIFQSMATNNNITGSLGLIVNYMNLLLIVILSLIGLVIVFAAWAIVQLINTFFGIDIFSLSLPTAQ